MSKKEKPKKKTPVAAPEPKPEKAKAGKAAASKKEKAEKASAPEDPEVYVKTVKLEAVEKPSKSAKTAKKEKAKPEKKEKAEKADKKDSKKDAKKKKKDETLAADFFAPSDDASEPTKTEPGTEEAAAEAAKDAEDAAVAEVADEKAKAEQRANWKATLEALVFAATEPLSVRELARVADCKMAVAKELLSEIKTAYDTENRAWELLEIAGGFRLMTRPKYHPQVQKLNMQRMQRKLTQAALETLALIAYSKNPVSRPEIEQIRGVDSAPIVKQLLERRLIQITGRGTGLGQPLLYGVSEDFLKHFGLKSAEELPQPGDFKSLSSTQAVQPITTPVEPVAPVSDNGGGESGASSAQ
jgi:segregation and condensation protein B